MKKPKRVKREASVESEDSFEDNSSDEEVRMRIFLLFIKQFLINYIKFALTAPRSVQKGRIEAWIEC